MLEEHVWEGWSMEETKKPGTEVEMLSRVEARRWADQWGEAMLVLCRGIRCPVTWLTPTNRIASRDQPNAQRALHQEKSLSW